MDLRRVKWDADPHEVATELDRRGLLPDLHGWTVLFVGLGDVAGDQAPLGEIQRQALVGYWTNICRKAGARACRTDNAIRTLEPSRNADHVSPVSVESATSVEGPDHATEHSLPATFLFSRNSAVLSPGADSLLGPIVALVRSGSFEVRVVGHTDASTGSAPHNDELSQQRARAVADRLLSLGIPGEVIRSVKGLGSTGTTRALEETDGIEDASKAAKQRYVRIHVVPIPAASS
jgi:outer membrane protein OmpA-like peptidoglycan-associated protein